MAKAPSKLQRLREQALAFLDEKSPPPQQTQTKLHRFIHFWVLVWTSFIRNRCPVRASGLAYVTLLAFVPLLAVVMSITSSLLKTEGEEKIQNLIEKFVYSVTPPAMLSTNQVTTTTNLWLTVSNVALPTGTGEVAGRSNEAPAEGANTMALSSNSSPGGQVVDSAQAMASVQSNRTAVETNIMQVRRIGIATNQMIRPNLFQHKEALEARNKIAHEIHKFIQNTRSGTLGVTGSILLVFAAISLLARVEDAFNDIWGAARRRTWFMRIVLYWSLISLAPILLASALGLSSGPHLQATKQLINTMPFVGHLFFQVLPILLLCLTFAFIYMMIPNTKVGWRAAAIGGLSGGVLFHLNNVGSVLYVSRVVSNSKIYGSLGLVPVFMIGLYFSWLILLFGAQVAYAYQNRLSYFEERQVESVNQRGREFLALRLMTYIGQRFNRGETPPSTATIADELCVPGRLIRQIMQTLSAARLVVEGAGTETGFLPARPLQNITCYDILLAMRAAQGQELATRDEPVRQEVYGEFMRIQEAERSAAASVSLLALVNRADAQLEHANPTGLLS